MTHRPRSSTRIDKRLRPRLASPECGGSSSCRSGLGTGVGEGYYVLVRNAHVLAVPSMSSASATGVGRRARAPPSSDSGKRSHAVITETALPARDYSFWARIPSKSLLHSVDLPDAGRAPPQPGGMLRAALDGERC
jgi:hypothetical protein